MTHRHTFGAKGRPPRPGDLCLTCPIAYEDRGRGELYTTSDYDPRVIAHRIHTRAAETDNAPAQMADSGTGVRL